MTGINSHVILPLARDCEEARADVWVIYMGNNEVVGPFGAGTVFGSQTTAAAVDPRRTRAESDQDRPIV